MPAGRKKVHAGGLDIDGNLAHPLHGVGMEGDPPLPAGGADLLDGLDGADFVVRPHDRNKVGVGPDGRGDIPGRDAALFVRKDVGDFGACLLEHLAGVQDGGVLDRARDEVSSPARC